jgi:hypothetical protein
MGASATSTLIGAGAAKVISTVKAVTTTSTVAKTTASTGAASVVTSADEVGVASVAKPAGGNGSTGAPSVTASAQGSTVTAGELAGTADQVFPGVTKGSYNPTGQVVGQATGDSCAAGCTRMAAVPDVPEFYIRDAIGTQANQGTNLANIPSGLQDLGYKGSASYTANATIDSVAQQTASGNAVILNVKTPGGDVHAIVVDSISNGIAYIRDPLPMPGSIGSGGSAYSIPASALENQMTGKAVYIKPASK